MSAKILVVEDEADLADFLLRGLREEGYVVEHSADGRDAALRMRDSAWDLVLLDWGLPQREGLDVLREYRRGGGQAPVLFLTARDAVSDRVGGLDGGADDYLTKPFSFEELPARMHLEALWTTVSAEGDNDTNCAIVGGIVALSAEGGFIPPEWPAAREPLSANPGGAK